MPDAMPHSVLPTVFDHCTPAIWGKTTTFTFPYSCTSPTLVTIKGGGGLPLKGDGVLDNSDHGHPHSRSSSPLSTTEHTLQPIPPLTETWEHPSFSHLTCTPYYKHSGCKIIQCPRTPLCWTYNPAAGTRINPCVTVLPLASSFGTRKHTAFTSWDLDPRVGTPTVGAPGRGR